MRSSTGFFDGKELRRSRESIELYSRFEDVFERVLSLGVETWEIRLGITPELEEMELDLPQLRQQLEGDLEYVEFSSRNDILANSCEVFGVAKGNNIVDETIEFLKRIEKSGYLVVDLGLDLVPDFDDALFQSRCYLREGDLPISIRYARLALKAWKGEEDLDECFLLLGLAYQMAGNAALSRRYLEQVAERCEDAFLRSEALRRLVTLEHSFGRHGRALQHALRALEEFPEDGYSLFAVCNAYLLMGDHIRALVYLKRALATPLALDIIEHIASDADFSRIRSLPDYQVLLEGVVS